MGFTGREPPFFFMKPADAVLPVAEGEVGRMPYPSLTKNLHHEVELVVAIGNGGRDITAADAMEPRLGLRRRPRHDAPRPAGRGEEAGPALGHRQGLRPFGADRADPRAPPSARSTPTRAITLEVNGNVRQQSTIGKLIWNIAEIIEHLSAAWELQPGDLIFTGTPEGVAAVGRGDVLKASVDGVGSAPGARSSRPPRRRRVVQLYNYFRSSASYRVRIALALKGLTTTTCRCTCVKNEQLGDAVPRARRRRSWCRRWCSTSRSVAPLTQSLAIIEYLDETHPEPPLLPADALGRARVRAIALDIACEIHPLDNLRVLRYLVRAS